MIAPPKPRDEVARLAALSQYQLIGLEERPEYNFLTELAAEVCQCPVAMVSLIAEDKQWYLARHGTNLKETSRDVSFCGHAILNPSEPFIVADALQDERFRDNPLVVGPENVRFYAGIPLVNKNGHALGSFCVVDHQPHALSQTQLDKLKRLAQQVVILIESRGIDLENQRMFSRFRDTLYMLEETQKIHQIGAWELDPETNRTVWTEEVYRIHDLPLDFDHNKESAIGFYHPEDQPLLIAALEHTLKTGDPFDVQFRLKTAKGRNIWVRSTGKRQEKLNGKTILLGTFQDITESKRLREELVLNAQTFKGYFDHAPIGKAIINASGQVVRANSTLCALFGLSEANVVGRFIHAFIHPESLHQYEKLVDKLLAGKQEQVQEELTFCSSARSNINTLFAATAIKMIGDSMPQFLVQVVDVSDLKYAQHALQLQLSKNQALSDSNTLVGIVATDTNGLITDFNRGAERLLGYTAEEVVGIHSPTIFHLDKEIQEESRTIKKEFKATASGFEVFVYRAKKGESFTREWTFVHQDGHHFPVQLSVTAILDGNDIVGYLGVAMDISEIKKAEREIKGLVKVLQDQNDRLRNFAHIVSHNLRSHSTGLLGLLDCMRLENEALYNDELVQFLQKGVTNMHGTIQGLGEVIRHNLTGDTFETVRTAHVLDKTLSLLKTTLDASGLQIQTKIDPDFEAKAIPAYMDSIFLNLISNAIKYRDPKKKSWLRITLSVRQKFYTLTFEDNGLGLDLSQHGNNLFGLFKTFHSHPDSRGIGLFITRNQIENMGGTISVNSTPGEGTTFTIILKK